MTPVIKLEQSPGSGPRWRSGKRVGVDERAKTPEEIKSLIYLAALACLSWAIT